MSELFQSQPSISKSYNEQRYDRLLETIDEYLGQTGTDDVGIGPLLRDLRKACIELSYHHSECLDGFNTLKDLIQ